MKFNISWDKFKIFYHVAQAGSFSEAAQVLHTTQLALSRSVKSLEDQLNVRLFERVARGVVLTPKGTSLYTSVDKIYDEFIKSARTLQAHEKEAKGVLKIALLRRLVSKSLLKKLTDFIKNHENIKLKIVQFDHADDFKSLQVDVALMPAFTKGDDLIQESLYTLVQKFYATSPYFKKYGKPRDLEDLQNHHLIFFNHHEEKAVFVLENNNTKNYNTVTEDTASCSYIDSREGMSQIAETGLGIALLIEDENPSETLLDVLPDFKIETPLYFITAPHLSTCKRIQLFKKYMQNMTQTESLDSSYQASPNIIFKEKQTSNVLNMY